MREQVADDARWWHDRRRECKIAHRMLEYRMRGILRVLPWMVRTLTSEADSTRLLYPAHLSCAAQLGIMTCWY